MNKTIISILLAVTLVLSYIALSQHSKIKEQKYELKVAKTKTDTILVWKEIKIPVPYQENVSPEKVIIYQDTGTIRYRFLQTVPSGWILFNTSRTDSVFIRDNFLKLYPQSEKLLSFNLTHKKLGLQLLGIDGLTKQKEFDIDIERYNYIYTGNSLSQKKKFKLNLYPEVEYSVRPLNNLHDINVGLSLNTRNFNYVMGVSGYWYPTFQTMGYDLRFTVRYKFR